MLTGPPTPAQCEKYESFLKGPLINCKSQCIVDKYIYIYVYSGVHQSNNPNSGIGQVTELSQAACRSQTLKVWNLWNWRICKILRIRHPAGCNSPVRENPNKFCWFAQVRIRNYLWNPDLFSAGGSREITVLLPTKTAVNPP